MEVPVGDHRWSNRCQSIGTFYAQHGTGVGISEIVKTVVVSNRVSGDVIAGFFGRDVLAGFADDDHNLALVVQPLATIWANHVSLVRIERGDGLMKISWRRGQLGHELIGSRLVIQVHCQDLGRFARR